MNALLATPRRPGGGALPAAAVVAAVVAVLTAGALLGRTTAGRSAPVSPIAAAQSISSASPASPAAPASPASRGVPASPSSTATQAAPGPPAAALPATLIVTGARVWTGDRGHPWAEAVAVRGERIVAVGPAAEIERLAGPGTRRVAGRGGMVTPGFIDSHVHFLDGGFGLGSVKLRDAASRAEFVRRIAEFARTAPAGAWILGGDWDHELWGGELPRRDWIDAVTPDRPVWVNRLDGHMSLANSAALRAAGVTPRTPDPAGGTIVRGPGGEPTGILKDNAMDLVDKMVPEAPPAAKDQALDAAMRYAAAQGVTSVVHMGTWEDLEVFRRAHDAGRMIARIHAAVPLATWQRLRDEVAARGRGDAWLAIGGLKGFVDGSLGSRTAAFEAPYADAPGNRGLLVNQPEDLYEWTAGADRSALQVIVHAIGDRAIHLQLDIFERVAREDGPHDRRFRIEHAQHLTPADIPRFAALGVIASMQPYHAIDDGRWAEKAIGAERAKTTYAFRSLLDAGATLAFGSDWPVAPAVPLMGLYAALTRRTLDDRHPEGWVPSQKITLDEALAAYTRDAAYAAFAERDLGTLEPGKLADLVLVDRDLGRIPPPAIRDAKVLLTVVGGKVVFEAPGMAASTASTAGTVAAAPGSAR
jgi:predicted amidohydrolase YtcJ